MGLPGEPSAAARAEPSPQPPGRVAVDAARRRTYPLDPAPHETARCFTLPVIRPAGIRVDPSRLTRCDRTVPHHLGDAIDGLRQHGPRLWFLLNKSRLKRQRTAIPF